MLIYRCIDELVDSTNESSHPLLTRCLHSVLRSTHTYTRFGKITHLAGEWVSGCVIDFLAPRSLIYLVLLSFRLLPSVR